MATDSRGAARTAAPADARATSQNPLLALGFALLVLEGYDLAALGVTLPSMLADETFGMSTAQGGVAGAVTAVGMLLGAALSGVLAPRIGPRRLLIVASIALPLGMIVCAAAPAAALFIAGRAIVGIGLGTVLPTLLSLIADLTPGERRSRSVGIAMAGMALGGLCAPLIAAALLPAQSFRWIYVIGAVPALVAIPFLIRMFPESPVHLVRTGRVDEAREIVGARGIPLPVAGAAGRGPGIRALFAREYRAATIVFWVMAACALLLVFGVTVWPPTIMQQAGYELGSALLLTAVVAVGAGVGMIVGGRLADAIGPKPIAVGLFLLGAVSLVLVAQKPDLWALLILMLACGAGLNGTQAILNAYVLSRYPADLRSTALSWTLAVGRIGAIAGPIVGASVLASGVAVQWNFYAFAIVGVLGAALAFSVPAARQGTRPAATS